MFSIKCKIFSPQSTQDYLSLEFCQLFLFQKERKEGVRRAYSPECRTWRCINIQHTLQSFKNMFLSRHLDQNMQRNNLLYLKTATEEYWCVQTLGAHRHTLQSFKNTILSRNLDQNTLKNTLFLEKAKKSPQCWRLRPQTPMASVPCPLLCPQSPKLLFSPNFLCYF